MRASGQVGQTWIGFCAISNKNFQMSPILYSVKLAPDPVYSPMSSTLDQGKAEYIRVAGAVARCPSRPEAATKKTYLRLADELIKVGLVLTYSTLSR